MTVAGDDRRDITRRGIAMGRLAVGQLRRTLRVALVAGSFAVLAACGGSSHSSGTSTTLTPTSGKITVRSTETLKSQDVTDGGVAGTGRFRISGAISDAGPVTDYRTVNGSEILIRRVAVGKRGMITFRIKLDMNAPSTALGEWTITSATRSYEGLHGSGKQIVDEFESSPATFALAGTVSQ
jgi:hypothetical protein